MLEGYAKKVTQPLIKTFAHKIGPVLKADTLTAFGFLFGVATGVAIAFGYNEWALVSLAFSGVCDVLDGALARGAKTQSSIGAFKDLVADRMVEASLMLGFVSAEPDYGFVCLLFMTALLLHFSVFGIAQSLFSDTAEKSFHYYKSYVERLDAFLVFGFVLLFPVYTEPMILLLALAIFIDGALRLKNIMVYAQDQVKLEAKKINAKKTAAKK